MGINAGLEICLLIIITFIKESRRRLPARRGLGVILSWSLTGVEAQYYTTSVSWTTIGSVVGSVVGAVIFLICLLISLCAWCYRRSQRNNANNTAMTAPQASPYPVSNPSHTNPGFAYGPPKYTTPMQAPQGGVGDPQADISAYGPPKYTAPMQASPGGVGAPQTDISGIPQPNAPVQ